MSASNQCDFVLCKFTSKFSENPVVKKLNCNLYAFNLTKLIMNYFH